VPELFIAFNLYALFIGKNETINMNTLEGICRTLECNIEDVVQD